MPHFAARSIPSRAHLEDWLKALSGEVEDWLKALSGEVGITEIVALAGAVDQPVGDFDSSMAMLDTGLFDKYAIRRIGIAGHPEGSPDISDEDIRQALAWKNAFAATRCRSTSASPDWPPSRPLSAMPRPAASGRRCSSSPGRRETSPSS
jgi:5,10-methylenetetrahydrofolate reductase